MDTSTKQKLKAQAHHLKPIIILGAQGLSDSVLNETDLALTAHELIKIKMKGLDKNDKKANAEIICERLGAELVQMIGNIIVVYRQNPPA